MLNPEIPLSLHRARVIHANKFTETRGGALNLPVSSTLFMDVVFRFQETGEDYKSYLRNLDLPIYTEQEVTLVCSGTTAVGVIDNQTNYYYYLTNDLSGLLGLGLPHLWVWAVGILGGAGIYFLNDSHPSFWILLPLLAIMVFYWVQKWILNYRIKKTIDKFLR